MSDSQAVTIPAADHAETAETWPVRLLKALAQNPEPLSSPALASLLAEPGQGRRLLISCASALRRLEQPATQNEQAARLKDAAGPPSSGVSPPQAAAGSTNTTQHEPSPRPRPSAKLSRHSARPPNGTMPWTKPARPSTARLRGPPANKPPTSYEISAAPSTRSAPSSTSAKRGSARTYSGTRRHARPSSPHRALRQGPVGPG